MVNIFKCSKITASASHRFPERDGSIFGVVVTAQGHGRLNVKGYASSWSWYVTTYQRPPICVNEGLSNALLITQEGPGRKSEEGTKDANGMIYFNLIIINEVSTYFSKKGLLLQPTDC